MAVTHAQVSVTTSTTSLAAETDDSSGSGGYMFRNTHASVSVYVGGSGVTSGTGLELKAGEVMTWELLPGETLYAAAGSGTVVVARVRSGL
jgi:hypothetical protein